MSAKTKGLRCESTYQLLLENQPQWFVILVERFMSVTTMKSVERNFNFASAHITWQWQWQRQRIYDYHSKGENIHIIHEFRRIASNQSVALSMCDGG